MAAATDSVMSGESWGGLQSLNLGVSEDVIEQKYYLWMI